MLSFQIHDFFICYCKFLYIYAKRFREILYNPSIGLQWVTILRKKTPILIIVKHVTLYVANNVIGQDIY